MTEQHPTNPPSTPAGTAEADTSSPSAQREGENLTPTQQKARRAAAEAEARGHRTLALTDEDAR